MKDFLKWTLAVMCGIFIMSIIGFFMTFGFIGAMAALGDSTPVLPREGVLKVDMSSFVITEQEQKSDPLAALQGDNTKNIGLWNAVQAIHKAAEDPAVKFIYLKTDGNLSGLAAIEEFRSALADFRESGKAIISYNEFPTTGSYYLSSVADKIYVSSYAGTGPMMVGIGTQLIFVKDLLDKLGINMQLIRHGKYKSAGEMYIKNAPSDENMEQNQAMINSLWETVAGASAESRHIDVETYTGLINNLELTTNATLVSSGLADATVTKEEMKEKLALLSEVESFKDVKMIQFADYVKVKSAETVKSTSKIAIIYADGEIVEGSQTKNIAGDRFAKEIAKVRADSSIKAVVLRVASPGGSVSASDKIKVELDLLGKVKPLVASYGSYAASGGYWISNNCERIFTDRTTLTGSIGVFSLVPDFSKTAKNLLHVNITAVGSGKHTDMYNGTRSLDAAEYDYMQKSVDDIYTRFVATVSEGRDLEPDFVDSIAQGRVWTGADALKIGLVDEIGTLEDAVHYAMGLACGIADCEMSDWKIVGYPAPTSEFETMLAMFSGESLDGDNDILAKTPFANFARIMKKWNPKTSDRYMARMPYLMEFDY